VRSAKAPRDQIQAAAAGYWPVRNADDEAHIRERADFLIGISRGHVVGAWTIQSVDQVDGRLHFKLAAPPTWVTPMVGNPPPDLLRFSQGERWPVKTVDSAEIRTLLENGAQELRWRGFTLTVDPSGHLTVVADGRQVTIVP